MDLNLIRNIGALSENEQSILQSKKIFICGCGGLGGYAVEFSARLGFGNITVCDGDKFETTNLNRQILCTSKTLGKLKAEIAKERIYSINPKIKVNAICENLNQNNAYDFIKNSDIVIDALDNIASRLILEKACSKANIPMVYGAIERWCGQVATIFPNDNSLEKIYTFVNEKSKPSILPFSAGVISCYQMSEVVKTLLQKPNLKNKILIIDLIDYSTNILNL